MKLIPLFYLDLDKKDVQKLEDIFQIEFIQEWIEFKHDNRKEYIEYKFRENKMTQDLYDLIED